MRRGAAGEELAGADAAGESLERMDCGRFSLDGKKVRGPLKKKVLKKNEPKNNKLIHFPARAPQLSVAPSAAPDVGHLKRKKKKQVNIFVGITRVKGLNMTVVSAAARNTNMNKTVHYTCPCRSATESR